MNLSKYIRDIPDFPKKGIVYKDITPLLQSSKAFSYLLNILYKRYKNQNLDLILGVEARGFIFAASLATKLGCGFVPIRKKNKLPYKTFSAKYQLEYGHDIIEIHKDSIKKNAKVLIVDDVLATGGTINASLELLSNFDCKLYECCFIIQLMNLNGIFNIKKEVLIHSIIKF